MATETTPSHDAVHSMICEAQTAAEALFVCVEESCGRRVVIGKSRPGLTVIDRGDFRARHIGGSGGVAMGELAAR
jgi:hypothetical protein